MATRIKQGLRLARAALLVIASLGTASSWAATQYFLKFDGIQGGSASIGNEGEISVLSFNWGVKQVSGTGGGSGLATGKPVFDDLTWTQNIDISTPPLFSALTTGTQIAFAELDGVRTGEASGTFFTLRFDAVRLSSMNIAGSSPSLPFVAGALYYDKVTLTYRPELPDGALGSPVSASYDLVAGTGSVSALLALYTAASLGLPPPELNPIPIPAGLPMLLSGVACIAGAARRRHRAP